MFRRRRSVRPHRAMPVFATVLVAANPLFAASGAQPATAVEKPGIETPARLVPQSAYVSVEDYPEKEILAGAYGKTDIAVSIGADGLVQSCTITGTSGSPLLDRQACLIVIGRWQYEPATLDGKPVPSTDTRTYTWQLGSRSPKARAIPLPPERQVIIQRHAGLTTGEQPARPIPETMQLSLDDYPPRLRRSGVDGTTNVAVLIATDGLVHSCTVVGTSGSDELDKHSCRIAIARWQFNPATLDGKPVPSTVYRHFAWVAVREGKSGGRPVRPLPTIPLPAEQQKTYLRPADVVAAPVGAIPQ